jgi:uncharacterized protein YegP (UPF0339 family)
MIWRRAKWARIFSNKPEIDGVDVVLCLRKVLTIPSLKEVLEENRMPGKFEIKIGRNGKFSFNLKAPNGQVILSSETYESRKGAEGGIASVRKNAGNAARFERKTAKDGSAYFVLKASNGETIGKSEMYKTEKSMENGIASVAKNAQDAPIVDAAVK